MSGFRPNKQAPMYQMMMAMALERAPIANAMLASAAMPTRSVANQGASNRLRMLGKT